MENSLIKSLAFNLELMLARIKYKEAAGIDAKRRRVPPGDKPTKSELEGLYLQENMFLF